MSPRLFLRYPRPAATRRQSRVFQCPLDVMGDSAVVDPKTPARNEPATIFETASNG